jgi:hypothetical protein
MTINEHKEWVWVGRHHIISNGEILFWVIAIIVGIFGFWVIAGLAA